MTVETTRTPSKRLCVPPEFTAVAQSPEGMTDLVIKLESALLRMR